GSKYVITEGRDSGSAGIFRTSGELRTGLVSDIVSSVDFKHLIFEAPTCSAQMFFINMLGANANLGNVNPNNLLVLESQRCGLRSETFYVNQTS
ncbi:MAG: phosphosulfolactate synthase, partial [Proteobacteria bacterium]|nr:phosphosulfolactate synthase [Pseudomonadota bacterium]